MNVNGTGTIRLRWRALDINEWRAIPEEKRAAFERSKGKKNPPIRGADIPGRYFLDSYEGGKRETKNINLRTSYEARKNDETERLARQVAVNYGDMEWRQRHRFDSKAKGNIPFVEFYRGLVDGRHWAWKGGLLLLEKFPRKDEPIADIDYEWLRQLQEFILNSPTRSRRTLSQNSASTYYAKIKAALQIAVQRGLIATNPATQIKAIQQVPSQRVYLTVEELQKLADAPIREPEVKRALLFGCYTGLRLSDIQALTWEKVRNDRIELRLKKTKTPEWLDLSASAKKLMGERGRPDELVFDLPPDGTIWTTLQLWGISADITKHLSFHVSRHTFATLMLEQTKDIFLVSKLLGHSDLKPTLAYTKIVDDRKKNAMNAMPEIRLKSVTEDSETFR